MTAVQAEAVNLHRELLFLQAERSRDGRRGLPLELVQLANTPEAMARLEWLRMRESSHAGEWREFLRAAQHLVDVSEDDRLIPVDASESHFATTDVLLQHQATILKNRLTKPDRRQMQQSADITLSRIPSAAREDSLLRFTKVHWGTEAADRARLALAESYLQRGELLAAEQLFLQCLTATASDVHFSSRSWSRSDLGSMWIPPRGGQPTPGNRHSGGGLRSVSRNFTLLCGRLPTRSHFPVLRPTAVFTATGCRIHCRRPLDRPS